MSTKLSAAMLAVEQAMRTGDESVRVAIETEVLPATVDERKRQLWQAVLDAMYLGRVQA